MTAGEQPNPTTGTGSGDWSPDTAAGPRTRRDLAWAYAQPMVRQTWLNIGVWLPFLENPPLRSCRVSYEARESRHLGVWRIALPGQCWHCGRTDKVRGVGYEFPLRAFDSAVAICGAGVGTWLLLIFLWLVTGIGLLFWLSLVELVVVAGMLVLKSWVEPVHMRIFTCDEHAADLLRPDAVIDDEQLHVYMPSRTLAEAAREELQTARRKYGGSRAVTPEGDGPRRGPGEGASGRDMEEKEEPPKYYRPPVVDLPPIKLDE